MRPPPLHFHWNFFQFDSVIIDNFLKEKMAFFLKNAKNIKEFHSKIIP